MGRAANALIVASDQHSAYYDETDKLGGLLWGDASVAFAVSKERLTDSDMNELYLHTAGIATMQHANQAINLRPATRELKMNGGRDIFQQSCKHKK
jgi:3-oxoacyl-[acyl-carrier-protein] synthase-3